MAGIEEEIRMNRRGFLKMIGLGVFAPAMSVGRYPDFDPNNQCGYVEYFRNLNGMQEANRKAHVALLKFIPKEYHLKCSFRYKQASPDDPDPFETRGYVAFKYDPKRIPWREYA